MNYLGKKIKYLDHEFLVVKYDKDDSLRTYEIVLLEKFRWFGAAKNSYIYGLLSNPYIKTKKDLLENLENTRFEVCKDLSFIENSEDWCYFIKAWVDVKTIASNLIVQSSDNCLFDIYDL